MTRYPFRALAIVLVAFLAASAWAAQVPVTGSLVTPTGTRWTGKLVVTFPFAGMTDGSGNVVVPSIPPWTVVDGHLPSTATLASNGDMPIKGTYYIAALYDSFGNKREVFPFQIPAGALSFDIGSAQQTTITTSNVSLVSPASLTSTNAFTGINTFQAPVTFNSQLNVGAAGTLNFSTGAQMGGQVGGSPTFTGSVGFTGNVTANGPSFNVANFVATGPAVFATGVPRFDNGINNSGTGVKHKRGAVGCSTAASVGATCTSGAQSWAGNPFADTNYTLTCTLDTPTAVPVVSSVGKSTGTFTITIAALTASAATGSYNCTAIHD
jgi:hypothetical protein